VSFNYILREIFITYYLKFRELGFKKDQKKIREYEERLKELLDNYN